MLKKEQKGFTLVELIVVISILGILSAFAIPKFISLQSSAKASTIKGVSGAVQSASSLAHSLWIANGDTASTSITMEGVSVAMNATNGYPTVAGITAAVSVSSDITTTTAGTFTLGTATDCQVVYVNGNPPTITTTSTCA